MWKNNLILIFLLLYKYFSYFQTGNDISSPAKYPRSLSIDSPKPLALMNSPDKEYSLYPSFFLDESGGREMPIDVNPDGKL